jgi:hypothetical protein
MKRALVLALLALAPGGALAQAPDPVRLRDELRQVEALLDDAVQAVSRPNPGFVLAGAPSCRGYLLRGYGVVFVLPPRRLPAPGLWAASRRRPRPPGLPDRVYVLKSRRGSDLRELEAQVQAFQMQAQQQWEEFERAFLEVQARLAAAEAATLNPTPAPPAPKAPPVPPPVGPLGPPVGPWQFWSEETAEDREARTPERLVADTQEAVVKALEAHGHLLASLQGDEAVSVVVDFVSGTPFLDEDARPARSLTLRVRKRDLDERHAGRLAPDELRRRVEAGEY